jgi:hypothetical protein
MVFQGENSAFQDREFLSHSLPVCDGVNRNHFVYPGKTWLRAPAAAILK